MIEICLTYLNIFQPLMIKYFVVKPLINLNSGGVVAWVLIINIGNNSEKLT